MGSTLQEREYVRALADATNRLFAKGNSTPDAVAIAAEHFSGVTLGAAIVEDVRQKLKRIRDILVTDYEQPVVLVARPYYTRFRKAEPADLVEARIALAIGNGKRAEGIHRQTGSDDVLWIAAKHQDLMAGAGKLRNSADQIAASYTSGRLDADTAQRLITAAYDKAQQVSAPGTLLELMTRPDAIAEIGAAS